MPDDTPKTATLSATAPSDPPSTGLSLEWKLPLQIAALLVVVIAVFCVAAYHEMRESSLVAATDHLTAATTQLADLSQAGTVQRSLALRATGRSTSIQNALVSADARARAESTLVRAVRPGDSTWLASEVWTADRARVVVAGAPAERIDSVVLRRVMREARHTDAFAQSPLYVSGGQANIWTVVPIDGAHGILGFIAERRRIANSATTEQQIRRLIGQDVAVLFTNRTGDVWTDLRGRVLSPPVRSLPATPLFAIEGGSTGDAFGAQGAIRATPWIVVLTLPEETVLQRPRLFLQRMLAIGVVLLVIGTAGAWGVARRVTRPLRTLSDAADDVAAGQYDRRVPVETRDELGRLASTFNVMASGIAASHAELAAQFEEAVAARRAAEDARQAAQEANEAKSEFLALMSHELRTPLNAIGGYTEILELGIHGAVTAEQTEDLQRIRRSKDHLLSIIDDLLNHARLEAGQIALTLALLPVDDVLREVEALTAPQISARGVRYAMTTCGDGVRVHADREKLCQVLVNLVSNASRFTERDGVIRLACDCTADTVRVRVHDTGIGIPEDKLESIFEPFVQVDSGLTRRRGGTGLGLAISRQLAAAMGGSITVDSTLGDGSTFTLTLPRAGDAEDARGPRVASAPFRADRAGVAG
jgi:signal transduction histidine kinase